MSSPLHGDSTEQLQQLLLELQQTNEEHMGYRFWDILHWYPQEADYDAVEAIRPQDRTPDQKKLLDRRQKMYLERDKKKYQAERNYRERKKAVTNMIPRVVKDWHKENKVLHGVYD